MLEGAGIDGLITILVAADDVERGKPEPEAYLRAVSLFEGVRASELVAFEDTEAGVTAAKSTGLYCVALAGTHPAERLQLADELVETVDVDFLRRLLS